MNWISAIAVLLFLLTHNAHAQDPQLLEAAKKEGTLRFYGPSTLTHDGVQLLAQGVQQKVRH